MGHVSGFPPAKASITLSSGLLEQPMASKQHVLLGPPWKKGTNQKANLPRSNPMVHPKVRKPHLKGQMFFGSSSLSGPKELNISLLCGPKGLSHVPIGRCFSRKPRGQGREARGSQASSKTRREQPCSAGSEPKPVQRCFRGPRILCSLRELETFGGGLGQYIHLYVYKV